MNYKRMKLLVIAMCMICIIFVENIYAGCYANWYRISNCSECDASSYNSSQTDNCNKKHKRQNGIKLCTTHKKVISKNATYYKRGFVDYNCLAYALGINSPEGWVWPTQWKEGPDLATFRNYIRNKGYYYSKSPQTNALKKSIFYVYAENGIVKHFARKYTLDGKSVSGAATISKWGACSLYTTTSTDPYTTQSGYGKLVMVCYKQ